MSKQLRLHYRAAKLGIKDLVNGITPYVGYHHNKNLGDVELYNLTRDLYKGKELATDILKRGPYFSLSKIRSANYYLVGGGTLIFADNVLRACNWLKKASLRPVFLGTGVLDRIPEKKQLDKWLEIFSGAKYLGVRGHISQEILEKIGVKSEILGDLGFLVNLQLKEPLPSNGEVVIVPRSIRPSYYEYFEKDMTTRRLLGNLMVRCQDQGLKVKIVCVSADDKAVIRGWLKEYPPVDYVEYNDDFGKFKEVISPCACLVSMRMHPGIFAAAWGVPTILLDQRHKFFDSFSPIEDKVVDIVDPDGLDVDALMQLVQTNLQEPGQSRLGRFLSVKPLAIQQKKFFTDLEKF